MATTQIHGSKQIQSATITNDRIADDQITNAKINSAAAIAYSKLNLSASIVNADIATAAAIAYSKLNLSNSLVNADVNTAAAIAYSKLNLSNSIVNADIATAAAIAYSKLNLTGSIVSGDLATALYNSIVLTTGAHAFSADQSMGGFKLTNVATPTSGTDAANKDYVDGVSAGLDWKQSVRASTTGSDITLSGGAPDTLDGVSLATNDRILVKDQTTGSQNGIYYVSTLGTGSNGTWTRATDADTSLEVTAGLATFIEEGSSLADSAWVLITDNPITLGTTSLSFTQFTGLGQITAGAGLTKTGNTLNVGAGNGITVNADDVAVRSDTTGGSNLARAINVSSNGVAVKIDGTTIKENGSFRLYVDGSAVTGVNADLLDSLNSTDFLRSSASSNLLTGSTLTLDSGSTLNIAGTWKISGTTVTATAVQLNALGTFATRETPTGTVNGVNDTFTLASTPMSGSEEVYVNGIQQDAGPANDYTISSNVITFNAGAIPQTGSKVRVSYRY